MLNSPANLSQHMKRNEQQNFFKEGFTLNGLSIDGWEGRFRF